MQEARVVPVPPVRKRGGAVVQVDTCVGSTWFHASALETKICQIAFKFRLQIQLVPLQRGQPGVPRADHRPGGRVRQTLLATSWDAI
jgi:hypothetical protein